MQDLIFLERSYWQGFLRLLLLCPLLISCSAFHLTYSTADWILLWKLDGYFDLSASQEEYLDHQIEKFHVWHRRQGLPQYAQFPAQIDQFCKIG